MSPSAGLVFTAANIRALSTMSRCRLLAWSTRAPVYWIWALPEKNSAVAVWSAVRSLPVDRPIRRTSSHAVASRFEVIGGGGPESNCAPLLITSGVTNAIHGTNIDAKAGGVGRHTPGAG